MMADLVTDNALFASTVEHAAQIRVALRNAGITASVQSNTYETSSTIVVRVKAGNFAQARRIACEHEVVSRNEATGEFFGENRFVDVDWDPEVLAGRVEELSGMVGEALARLSGDEVWQKYIEAQKPEPPDDNFKVI